MEVPGTLVGVMAKPGVDALISGQPLPENNKAILLPHLMFSLLKKNLLKIT